MNLIKICKEEAILIQNKKINKLVLPNHVQDIKSNYPIKKEIDGKGYFLIPGLSDIHGHLTLISEFDLSLSGLYYFDAQRQKNCKEALKSGCTFVRDSGGAFIPTKYLKDEIENNRLLGPKIMLSYEVMTPKKGMWDVNPVANYFAPMIFGGKMLNFLSEEESIYQCMERLHDMGCENFKTYFEDKPLYGRTKDTVYNMFPTKQARFFRNNADKYNKILEAHSMFIKGSRRVIDAGFDSIAHMTVDAPYCAQDAQKMVKNNTAIVPTLSVGCYLAMNCGDAGYPDNSEFLYFTEKLKKNVSQQILKVTITELKNNYLHFSDWIQQNIPNRKMPAVGTVYPERCHGFMVHAAESFKNFQDAGTKVGIGTDGGTGITFVGHLDIEFETCLRYGYTPAQILRMATLGNMEIVRKDDEMGSIKPGKYADMVLLETNPLTDITAINKVLIVMKDGRVFFEKSVI